jgi:hypothetical protein
MYVCTLNCLDLLKEYDMERQNIPSVNSEDSLTRDGLPAMIVQ